MPAGGIPGAIYCIERNFKLVNCSSPGLPATVEIQAAFDPATGKSVEGNTAKQTERTLENVKAILQAAGSSLDRVVKVGVFLKDMNDFTAMNGVYALYFPANPPARTTVEVARLPRDFLVEMDVIAMA